LTLNLGGFVLKATKDSMMAKDADTRRKDIPTILGKNGNSKFCIKGKN